MSEVAMAEVLERFPSTKWCKPSSNKYDEAQGALAAFTDTDISTALASLRRNMTRSMVTVDEIIGEIRRLRRRSEIVERAQQEGINGEEVERQRQMVRKAEHSQNMLVLITEALRQLLQDEDFYNVLRAEGLDTLPRFLEQRIRGTT